MDAMISNTIQKKAFVLFCAIAALWSASDSTSFAKDTDKTAPFHSPTDWDVANSMFHQGYGQEKEHILATIGPVLIVGQGKITLLNGTFRKEVPDQDSLYDHLKIIDHEVLAIFIDLRSKCGQALEVGTLRKLHDLKGICGRTDATVQSMTLPDGVKRRQRAILKQSIDFIDLVLKNNSVSDHDLRAFTRSTGMQTLENVSDATEARLGELQKSVASLIDPLPSSQRRHLHVIVIGSHMARAENAEMQFFEKLLGETQEGSRIIYFEGEGDEEKALGLLATHVLDADIGTAFYDDPWRMHRDLRCAGAKSYLEEHPPEPITR